MKSRLTGFAGRRRLGMSFALSLAALAPAVMPAADARAEGESYVFSTDVELAHVTVDGNFKVEISTPGGVVRGDLNCNTSVTGKLTGTLTIGSQGLLVKGTVERGDTGVHVQFKASTPGSKITFSGDVANGSTSLTGKAVGKGAIAAGTNDCTILLTGSPAEIATVECAVDIDARGKIKGRARVLACGDEVALKPSGKFGATSLTLNLRKGKAFRFTSVGVEQGLDLVVDWSAKGFGGFGSGTSLVVFGVDPPAPLSYGPVPTEFETDSPIATIIPSSGDAPRGRFTIVPSLPTGLTLDPATGRISGTPTAVWSNRNYTITAANYASTSESQISFGVRIPRARSFAEESRFLTDEDLRHFLSRAEFGVRQLGNGQTSLGTVKTMGLNAYLDQILVFSQTGPAEAIALPQLGGNFPSPESLTRWWATLMMNTDNPFQERLAFFWSDHFAVSADNLEAGEAHLMTEYVNLYRYGGNGNLRSLLEQMSKHGAMVKYLDGYQNSAGAVNENFAREFWELFTLGVDNGYTQADIEVASRAFTGFKLVTNPATGLVTSVFDPARHDTDSKTIFGVQLQGQDEVVAMVNLTLDTPGKQAAEYITKKLFEHFGFENPHPDLVAAMAKNLRDNDYEIAPFMKALFKSEAFYSTTARRSLVRNPVDYAIGFMHLTGFRLTPSSLGTQLAMMGQAPARPPSVNGWPQGELWFSAQNMADRANFLEACITAVGGGSGNATALLPPAGQRSSSQVVDAIANLFGLTLVQTDKQTCQNFLDESGSFEFLGAGEQENRARGLLAIMAQHPNFEVR